MDKKVFCFKNIVRIGILILFLAGVSRCFQDISLQKVSAQSTTESLEIYTDGTWDFCVVREKQKQLEINGIEKGKESQCIDSNGCLIIPSSIKKGLFQEYTIVGISVRTRTNADKSEDTFYAFAAMDDFTSVYIPEGVEYIGKQAFCGCAVESVTLPDSLCSIGEAAFGQCKKLKHIELPNNLETLEKYCFRESGLISVTIPSKVKVIPGYAFYGCTALKSIVLPEELEELGTKALPENQGLEITIPEKLTDISHLNLTKLSGVTFNVVAGGDVARYLTENNITYNTYAPSEEPTEEDKKTEVPTEEPTEEDKKTEVPTEEPTEEDKKTETPTEEPTEEDKKTETPTEEPTEEDKKTEAPTEEPTEEDKKTETPTEEPKEDKKTEAPTERPAEEDKKTEAPTEKPEKKEPMAEQPEEKTEIEKGSTYTVSSLEYKVLSDKQVSFAGTDKKAIKTLKIPATVTIGNQTFNVVQIEKGACKGFRKLESVTVGKNVSVISNEAFMNCKSLETITFGAGTKTIGKKVLKGDKKLTKVLFKGKKLKNIGKGTFTGTSLQKIKFIVPKGKNSKYKKQYAKLIKKAK